MNLEGERERILEGVSWRVLAGRRVGDCVGDERIHAFALVATGETLESSGWFMVACSMISAYGL